MISPAWRHPAASLNDTRRVVRLISVSPMVPLTGFARPAESLFANVASRIAAMVGFPISWRRM